MNKCIIIGLMTLPLLFPTLSLSQASQSGPGSTVTFEGAAEIESVTSACAANDVAVNQYYKIIYRLKVASTDQNDAILLFGTRSAFRVKSEDPTGTLNGNVQTIDSLFDVHAGETIDVSDTTNLQISTVGGNSLASAVNIKMLGTINDVFLIPGCNISIHGLLVVRAL